MTRTLLIGITIGALGMLITLYVLATIVRRAAERTPDEVCPRCGGSGVHSGRFAAGGEYRVCERCGGSGGVAGGFWAWVWRVVGE